MGKSEAVEPSRGKRLAFRLITTLVTVVITVVGLEVLSAGYIVLREGKYVSPREMLKRTENTFIRDVTTAKQGCRYVDTLFPHPYLAFVHHGNPPCGLTQINNVGLFGEDFPAEKRLDRFTVLLTGGSVAAQLGQLQGPGYPKYLEEALNNGFRSPNGKPFLVLNGADGAWKQPQQFILLAMYADVIDAVVTLDGFNELQAFTDPVLRLEHPANNFVAVNPLANRSYGQVIANWISGKIVGVIGDNEVLSRSHTAYFVARRLWRLASRTLDDEKRPTSTQSIFGYPEDWDSDRRFEAALRDYRRYILGMNAIARERKVLSAHFIQPVPAIGKKLSRDEALIVGDLSYGSAYLRMATDLFALRERGVEIHDLLRVFEGEEETIYEDAIHLKKDLDGVSKGYSILANHIAARLAESWKLGHK